VHGRHFCGRQAVRRRVEVFSIGFGKRLFGFPGVTRGTTREPAALGGYVRWWWDGNAIPYSERKRGRRNRTRPRLLRTHRSGEIVAT